MNQLICTVGLPRSGKTTWAKQQGFPIVNPDSIRLALYGQRYHVLAEDFVWAIAKVMVRSLFLAGHTTVILDATNITRKRRDIWGRSQDIWLPVFHLMSTTAAECLARAEGDLEIQPVIERMALQFEPLEEDEARYV